MRPLVCINDDGLGPAQPAGSPCKRGARTLRAIGHNFIASLGLLERECAGACKAHGAPVGARLRSTTWGRQSVRIDATLRPPDLPQYRPRRHDVH
eukprot:scaffold872_cov421-Prasinococcus_capsulatus_cf.AAC.23